MNRSQHLKLCVALFASLSVTLDAQPCAWAQASLRLERPEDLAGVKWPIEVSGQAPPSSRVRISLDGQVKATLRVGADGKFSHKIIGLPPKHEILQITAEQLDERDQVREQASIKVSLGAPIATPSPTPQAKPEPEAPPAQAERPADEPAQEDGAPKEASTPTLAPKANAQAAMPLSDEPLQSSAVMPSRRGAGFVPRLISQGLFSALIGGAGAAAGGVVSWRLTQRKLGADSIVEPFAIAAGAYLGGALLMPLGMYTGGELGQGDGSLLWTYVGGVVATGGAIYLAKRPWVGTTPALGALLILPPLGAWAGYELSSSSSEGADATLELIPTTDGAHAVFKMSW